jgi:hypothetical protein
VTNGIDTPLNPSEPPTRDPALDRPPAHSQSQELPTSNNPMLILSELSNPMVNRTGRGFSMRDMGNPRLIGHRHQ